VADPGVAVQKAVFEALDAALSCPVYDRVPQGAAYPYVTLSGQMATPDDPLNSRRDERFVYLNVWSQYAGQKEVLDIMATIDAILHRARLSMDSGRMVRAYVTRKMTNREPDNETYQGAVTVRILTEH
jgi:hypothetical protein